MLHNLIYNTSDKILEFNPSYDHVYLVKLEKVCVAWRFLFFFCMIIYQYE